MQSAAPGHTGRQGVPARQVNGAMYLMYCSNLEVPIAVTSPSLSHSTHCAGYACDSSLLLSLSSSHRTEIASAFSSLCSESHPFGAVPIFPAACCRELQYRSPTSAFTGIVIGGRSP